MPVSSWNRVTPSENRSDCGVTGRASSCSGAMYDGLPRITPVRVARLFSSRATPKSMTRTRRFFWSKTMFAGLMSRWITPRWCAK